MTNFVLFKCIRMNSFNSEISLFIKIPKSEILQTIDFQLFKSSNNIITYIN